MTTRNLEGSGAKVVSDNPKTDFYNVVEVMNDIAALLNELRTDHATFKTLVDELKTDLDATVVDVAALRASIVGITAKLDLDGGVTDTNYAALWDPAAQTGTAIAASSPAAVTAAAVDDFRFETLGTP